MGMRIWTTLHADSPHRRLAGGRGRVRLVRVPAAAAAALFPASMSARRDSGCIAARFGQRRLPLSPP